MKRGKVLNDKDKEERGQVMNLPVRSLPQQVTVYKRLDREIHGLLIDIGLMQKRTDEFVDQEELVKRFIEAWVKVVEKIEKKVIKQVEQGKKRVKI